MITAIPTSRDEGFPADPGPPPAEVGDQIILGWECESTLRQRRRVVVLPSVVIIHATQEMTAAVHGSTTRMLTLRTPSTRHQPGRVAVLTSHTIPDRADDQDHLSIQTIILEPVRCRRQRMKIQDHHVTMILIYARPLVSRPRPAMTSALGPRGRRGDRPSCGLLPGRRNDDDCVE